MPRQLCGRSRVAGKELTAFFSDIAGFTETTDRLESEDLTRLLKHYLTEMSQTALAYVRCSKWL
jgi:class 3 adenylate cyclase